MNNNGLEAAYSLIFLFKEGKIEAGSGITNEQIDLLRLLYSDLFPGEEIDEDHWRENISRIVREDTNWNHQTMEVIDEIYSLREMSKLEEVEEKKQTFFEGCPSSWYRGIVEAV